MSEKQQLEELIKKYSAELKEVQDSLSTIPNHDLYFKRTSLQIKINGIISMLNTLDKKKKKKYDYLKVEKMTLK